MTPKKRKLIYTAHSKHYFYFRAFISKFVVEAGHVPLNPFMIFDYFLLDSVPRDDVRAGNNTIVERSDEIWVFGPIADGVMAEIKLAEKRKVPVKYFAIEKSKVIKPIGKKEAQLEPGVSW